MNKTFNIRSIAIPLLISLGIFARVHPALACGGRLRFRQRAGPFIVTLFTAPDPLTRGRADFSVTVQRAGNPGLLEDAHIKLVLTRAGSHGRRLVLHATQAQAVIKWMQAATFSIPARGLWHITIFVRRGQESGQCSGDMRVRKAVTQHLTMDILAVPLIVFLFLIHESRKRKYKRDCRNHQLSAGSKFTALRPVP